MSNENGNSRRRENLLGDRPGSYAIARHVRMSPTKVRRVVDLVRGMDVKDALLSKVESLKEDVEDLTAEARLAAEKRKTTKEPAEA